MTRRITPQTTLDQIGKDAKRWLRELRANNAEARARFERAYAKASANAGLRDVQHALALEYGLPGWTALKQALENRPVSESRAEETHAQLIARFLDYACPDHHVRGRPAHRMSRHAAIRILQQHPWIPRDSIYTAVVCGEMKEAERILRERPAAVTEKSSGTAPDRADAGGASDIFKDIGPKGWEPLLYLCFTRLPLDKANENAVEIARMLLDHGADPNVFFMAGTSRYTPLVGAIGEGEEDRPPHPQREALARLLLERGAEPYDLQVAYNIHFHGKILWYMRLMYEFSVKAGRKADWDDPEWHMLNQGAYGSGARWHLWIAVQQNDLELAEWCLSHGASANVAPPSDERFSQRTLYEEAARAGYTEMAELLARYGATRMAAPFEGEDAFVAACLRLDRAEAKKLLEAHPEYLRSREAMLAAVRNDRADIVQLLLDLGLPVDVEYEQKQRPLHLAASKDAVRVAELLISRGAEIDPVELNWNNTPIDFAVWSEYPRMIELLGRYTREVGNLAFIGNVARLRELLATQPELAKPNWGSTPLFWLPEDEQKAVEIVDLFLARGADAFFRRKQDGLTAADIARRRGLNEAANRLAAAEAVGKSAPSTVPPYAIDTTENSIAPRRDLTEKEWDAIVGVMKEQRITALDASGLITDDLLKPIAELDHITSLSLSGSRQLTDDGLQHLARMPQLEHLDLNEYPGGKLTDRGLEVLRHLPNLRTFNMTWQRGISDAGVANLKFCEKLESVNLMGTPTGDGAIDALRGKPKLRRLDTGRLVTDVGLALLRDFPIFKTWHGGELIGAAMNDDDEPTRLLIDGPFTNEGLASLAGLDGLFSLDLFWHVTGITSDALEVLSRLPNLAALGCDGELSDDYAMRHIASIPRLRKLRAQGTVATDEGFIALSQSASLEKFWGRECPNLTGRGFVALSKMPALRALGVSCKNVDDEALSSLPRFPALRELTPIDVTDEGFRHVGRCVGLESLSCMYCRDTTDVATEYVAGLQLKSYYAGLTKISDRSLEILGRMLSLESIELYETKSVTDAGLAYLAGLPRLREIRLSGLPNVTFAGTGVFPAHVRVKYRL